LKEVEKLKEKIMKFIKGFERVFDFVALVVGYITILEWCIGFFK
jgi:hypothetical protein